MTEYFGWEHVIPAQESLKEKKMRLQEEILTWMNKMAKDGRYAQAGQSPMWREYEKVCDDLGLSNR